MLLKLLWFGFLQVVSYLGNSLSVKLGTITSRKTITIIYEVINTHLGKDHPKV